MLPLPLIFVLALGAGALNGVVGTGSPLIMRPVLVNLYQPRSALPSMAIASLFGNIGRVMIAWWHEIRWRPVLAHSLTGVPAAMSGAR